MFEPEKKNFNRFGIPKTSTLLENISENYQKFTGNCI